MCVDGGFFNYIKYLKLHISFILLFNFNANDTNTINLMSIMFSEITTTKNKTSKLQTDDSEALQDYKNKTI